MSDSGGKLVIKRAVVTRLMVIMAVTVMEGVM